VHQRVNRPLSGYHRPLISLDVHRTRYGKEEYDIGSLKRIKHWKCYYNGLQNNCKQKEKRVGEGDNGKEGRVKVVKKKGASNR
jgi:hypothetical protein